MSPNIKGVHEKVSSVVSRHHTKKEGKGGPQTQKECVTFLVLSGRLRDHGPAVRLVLPSLRPTKPLRTVSPTHPLLSSSLHFLSLFPRSISSWS